MKKILPITLSLIAVTALAGVNISIKKDSVVPIVTNAPFIPNEIVDVALPFTDADIIKVKASHSLNAEQGAVLTKVLKNDNILPEEIESVIEVYQNIIPAYLTTSEKEYVYNFDNSSMHMADKIKYLSRRKIK